MTVGSAVEGARASLNQYEKSNHARTEERQKTQETQSANTTQEKRLVEQQAENRKVEAAQQARIHINARGEATGSVINTSA